jgi:hypothetical protein
MKGRGARMGLASMLVVSAVLTLASCGEDSGPGSTSVASSTSTGPTQAERRAARIKRQREERARARDRRQAQRQRERQRERAAARQQQAALHCPDSTHVLDGVYHPDRLVVRDSCRRITGTVEDVRDEEDGDIHVLVRLDSQYRSMLMDANFSIQHGDLVVEFMPRDYGHLPRPSIGDRLVLVGAYVDDTQHSWAELHPVWSVSINGGPIHQSGPQFGGSPAYALSDNALATCRTNTGARCMGYNGQVAPPPSDESDEGGGGSAGGSSGGSGCTPGYSPCLTPASDYDCSGGSGDGPEYTGRVQVSGSDPYGLDTDGDGVGCE